ncbi:hypothetical protein [Pseudomonas sp. MPB23]|uniref:hypothetical protein n=1 Tax=Pseudomonas sp. MPB23 TaxID=3388490 RepID=UPI003984E071
MVEMATIRNRGEYQWEAQIRRKSYPAQRKTFETKSDAQAWARMIESEIDRGIFVSRVEAERTAFHQLIDRYISEITPKHKGAYSEIKRLEALKRHPLAIPVPRVEIPEAKVFLKALQRKKVMIQRDIEKDAFYREALFHDDAKAADSEQARRLGEVLFGFIEQASVTLLTENDAVWQSLAIVPRDDFTTGETELKNQIYRTRRRSELNAMIEEHSKTQVSEN